VISVVVGVTVDAIQIAFGCQLKPGIEWGTDIPEIFINELRDFSVVDAKILLHALFLQALF